MLTKDEVSDLRSHVTNLLEREKEYERAVLAREAARRILDNFLHEQQYPRKPQPGEAVFLEKPGS